MLTPSQNIKITNFLSTPQAHGQQRQRRSSRRSPMFN